jgi:hypothetical protein
MAKVAKRGRKKGCIAWNKGISKYNNPKHPNKEYYAQHREIRKRNNKEYYRKLRIATLELLDNKCCKCGFNDIRALQVDHINGGGSKEKKSITCVYWKYVINSILKEEGRYQLLCANCNWIKRVEEKEVRQ